MKKRNGKRVLGLALSLVMAFGAVYSTPVSASAEPSPITASSKYELRQFPNAKEITSTFDAAAAGRSAEELKYIDDFVTARKAPIGAVGFEDEYALDGGLVNIIVEFDTMPSAVAKVYNEINGIYTANGAVEAEAQTAITSFENRLEGITSDFTVNATYGFLLSGVSLTVPAEMVDQIAALPGVFAVTPDFELHALGEFSDFAGLGMKASRDVLRTGEINDNGLAGEGIVVGVLDTGIDYLHPDLAGAYIGGYDFVNDDGDPMETTYKEWQASGKPELNSDGKEYYTSHGTHVAGTIAARGANDTQFSTLGIAPEAKVRAYKVLGPYGSGATTGILSGIEKSVSDGCDVINLSLGANLNSAYYSSATALNNAVLAGVVVCVSAGNNGPNVATLGVPGAATALSITVGAANRGDHPTVFYLDANSSSAADETATAAPVSVIGQDFENLFQDGRIIAPNLTYVEGKGYEYVLVMAPGDEPTTTEQLAAIPDGSLEGKILVVGRGAITFTDIPPHAMRTKAGAILVMNSAANAGFITGITIGGIKAGHLPVLSTTRETRLDLISAYNRAKAASVPAYLNFGDVSYDHLQDLPASFSSRGPVTETAAIKPDITAPGVAIMSTQPAYIVNPDHNDTDYKSAYSSMQGTSMSCPHLAGISALMAQAFPNAAPAEIKARLMNSSEPLENEQSVYEIGAGFVNPYNAIYNTKSWAFVTDEIAYLNGNTRSTMPNMTLSSLNFGFTPILTSGVSTTKTLPVTVVNTTSEELSYSVSSTFNNQTVVSLSAQANGVHFIIDNNAFTVPANGSRTFNVKMTVPAAAAKGTYEGNLVIAASNGQNITMPFATKYAPSVPQFVLNECVTLKPIISNSTNSAVRSTTFANTATVYVEYEGGLAKIDTYYTDMDFNRVAYSGTYNLNTSNGEFYLTDGLNYGAFKMNGTQIDSKRTVMPAGAYYLNMVFTPVSGAGTVKNYIIGSFVVDGSPAKLTLNKNVFEYNKGASTITLEGNLWSDACALANEVEAEFGMYTGYPVLNQDANALIINGQGYMNYCDSETGNFSISYPVPAESRNKAVTIPVFGIGSLTDTVVLNNSKLAVTSHGVNLSDTKPDIVIVEAPEVTSVTGNNGSGHVTLSKNAYTVPAASEYVFQYSIDGGAKAPLNVTSSTPAINGINFTFAPFTQTSTAQTVTVYATYRGITTSYSFVIQTQPQPQTHVTAIKLNAAALQNIKKDTTFQLSYTTNPADTNGAPFTVTYTSSNPLIANVSSTGLVTAYKAGTTVITVTYTDSYGAVVKAVSSFKVTN